MENNLNDKSDNINNLGEFIKFYRQKKNYSIAELSLKTKIRCSQLEKLERNRFSELPSRVYLVGFLKSLSIELEMNLEDAIKLMDQAIVGCQSETFSSKKVRTFDLRISYGEIGRLFKTKSVSILRPRIMAKGTFTSACLILIAMFGYKINSKPVAYKMDTRLETVTKVEEKISPILAAVPEIAKEEPSPKKINLVINAKNGDSWLAFKTDQDRIVKFILKKGKLLEIKGEKIRLVVGNPDALQILKDGQDVVVEKKSKSTTVHLIFPEELGEKYKPPFFVFNEKDGSVMTVRQFEEKMKGI